VGRARRLAVWPKPEGCEITLGVIENTVLWVLEPPLNTKDVVTPWTTQVKAARKVMADRGRRGVPDT
jgi:hypothetical protein